MNNYAYVVLVSSRYARFGIDHYAFLAELALIRLESKHETVDKGVFNTVESNTVRNNKFNPPIIKDWNSDDESEIEFEPKVEVETVRHIIEKIKFVKTTKEKVEMGNPQQKECKEKGVIDSGCSRHITGNKCYLTEYEDYDGGFVILGMVKVEFLAKGKSKLLLDESQVLLRVPRKDNIYNVDLKSVAPTGGLTCLFAKATIDESNLCVMNQFCDMKEIKREFSVARTPQQNDVAERKNRTLIEAARTMLVDSKFPTTFWAEAVNTACYVLNRALVIKPYNKTPYELIRGRPPLIDFIKPFRCPVTILNTRDHLGKFDEKANEGFFVRYSVISKAMRVFNKRTRIVEETLNIRFLKNEPNVKGNRPDWLFDIDSLTISMNYVSVVTGNQTNGIAGTKDNIVAGQAKKKKELEQEYHLLHICIINPLISQGPKDSEVDAGKKAIEVDESGVSDNGRQDDQAIKILLDHHLLMLLHHQLLMLLELFLVLIIFGNAYDDEAVEEEVDMNNVVSSYTIPDAPSIKFLKDHPKEPKKLVQALKDPSWVEAMQDELLWFKLLKVWTLVDLPSDKWAIGTKWVFRNKKDEIGIVVKNKARLVAQGHTQEEGELSFFLGLQVQSKSDGIFIIQDKYVANILKKFDFATVKTAGTLMEPNKALIKDEEAEDTLHLHAVKRIFRYLKGQPKLGLWYLRDSPFDLEAYSDSDYAGASLDRKSTIGEYVAAANCCRQVLWIQNQMLDYGFNFMNTKIYIDNENVTFLMLALDYLISKVKVVKLMIAKDKRCFMDKFKVKTSNSLLTTARTTKCKATQISQSSGTTKLVADETVHKKRGDRMEMAATTASSLKQSMTVDASKQVRSIKDIDQDAKISLVDKAQGRMHDVDMFRVDDLEVTTANVKVSATLTTTKIDVDDELALAKTLIVIKAAKPKVIPTTATTVTTVITTPRAKGIVFHEQVQALLPTISSSKDKGKAKMIEPKIPLKRKDQMRIDEKYVRKLEAEEQETARLKRAQQDEEANIS
nr:putative ribonuclease H-like domain-containing protein [Tanacetum cinerariifolium]